MIELGRYQRLKAIRQTEFGMYLNTTDGNNWEDTLLPKNQVPQGMVIGDEIDVFIYNDSKDRMIATIRKPMLTLGEIAVLTISQVTDIGAFLDWGLEKELLLPFKEQRGTVKEGDEIAVALYADKSKRLCATMKLYDYLRSDPPYKKDQRVSGVIYNINKELGYFVAVENKYHGLILNKEMYGNYRIGDIVNARVLKLREDGKLELALRQSAYLELEKDAQIIMQRLKDRGGSLPLNDDSDPESVKAELSMSKKAFKRAVGRLMKEGAIKITEDGIRSQWE